MSNKQRFDGIISLNAGNSSNAGIMDALCIKCVYRFRFAFNGISAPFFGAPIAHNLRLY